MQHCLTLLLLLTSSRISSQDSGAFYNEDDMRLSAQQWKALRSQHSARNAMPWSIYYWPQSTLVYSIASGFSKAELSLIAAAMDKISAQTCLRFRRSAQPREPQVVIQRKDAGCWSYVGYLGLRQELNLGRNCMLLGIVQHELLHALGFRHMHTDPRRDNFVRIAFENIMPEKQRFFVRDTVQGTADLGVDYDYASIMHYGPFAFSKNGQRTIVPLQGDVHIGQKNGLSAKDVLKLSRIYCT
ncbi:zinc metalloproteinase nas-13 [Scaptodrosophila lebanonensis]|uniref:Metalloendopeptidase n=1 Tax=Drosophila lebanonensis TaxID=7225 RepID=A0A6J2U8D1_DROLE|nr:zinc metalloproteinase nas-13 [Scaptodrosophila lebanonensis]